MYIKSILSLISSIIHSFVFVGNSTVFPRHGTVLIFNLNWLLQFNVNRVKTNTINQEVLSERVLAGAMSASATGVTTGQKTTSTGQGPTQKQTNYFLFGCKSYKTAPTLSNLRQIVFSKHVCSALLLK